MLDLSSYIKALPSLIRFINGGVLSTILTEIGDIHFESAKQALQAGERDDFSAHVREAIGHIRTARIAYAKQVKSNELTGIVFSRANWLKTYNKQVWAAILLPTCYASLGDTNNTRFTGNECIEIVKQRLVTQEQLDNAGDNSYSGKGDITMVTNALNPLNYLSLSNWIPLPIPIEQGEDYDKLLERYRDFIDLLLHLSSQVN